MGILSSLFGGSGKSAQQASLQASELAAKGIDTGRQYLQEADLLPRSIREGALTGLAGYYGVPGFDNRQQEFIDSAKMSPLYQAILGTRQAGEQSIMRNAAATGGLRSGATNLNLSDYNSQLENQALLESLNQQVGGYQNLMGLDSLAPQIADMYGDAANTRGQGIVAGQQAREQAKQNRFSNILSLGKIGLAAYGGI